MVEDLESERRAAVERYQAGESATAIAASLRRSPQWVWKWVQRFSADDSTWARDRSRRPRSSPRSSGPDFEALVLETRDRLEDEGAFHGAQAILWELEEAGVDDLPTARTIARILARHGAVKRPARYQPKGKRYPAPDGTVVGAVHQTDFLGPRFGERPLRFYSLNSVDLATGRCAVEPVSNRQAQTTINAIWATWCRLGLPRYQQVDNELVFFGSRRYPRGMGPLIRLCLHAGVEPLFIPVAEPWRNGVVEKFNQIYEDHFRRRVHLTTPHTLTQESRRFEERHNGRYRYTKLKGQTPLAALKARGEPLRFPDSEVPRIHPIPKPPNGRYHFVRFIRSDGQLDIFGEHFVAPPEAMYEYLRATVDVAEQRLHLFLDNQLIESYPYEMR